MRLPYHIRVNIKEPRETDYVDLKRRKHERFEDYQIRVHFDYLDRREINWHALTYVSNYPMKLYQMKKQLYLILFLFIIYSSQALTDCHRY